MAKNQFSRDKGHKSCIKVVFDFVFLPIQFLDYRQYRKRNTELASQLANSDSSDADISYNNECTCHDIADDKVEQKSVDYRGGSVRMHFESVDSSDSDYDYDEVVFSSDAEVEYYDNLIAQQEEEACLSEFLAPWASKHRCTRSCINELL